MRCVRLLCHNMSAQGDPNVHAPWRKHTWLGRLIRGTLDVKSKRWEWLIVPLRSSYAAARVRKVSAVRGDEPVTFR